MTSDYVYALFYVMILLLLIYTPYTKFFRIGKVYEAEEIMEAWVRLAYLRKL